MKLIYHRQQWPDQDSTYIMTEDGSGMVRVTFNKLVPELKEALISDLYVNEGSRNKGIGTQLLQAAIKEFAGKVNNVYLTVKCGNPYAFEDYPENPEIKKYPETKKLVDFYKSCGFKIGEIYSNLFCMNYVNDK